MEGWLQMREEGGGWHMRWFVLKDGQLQYFKKRDDKVKGSFSISDALVGNTCGIDGKKDFLFALQMPGRTLYLQGRSADEVNEWTVAINKFTAGSLSSAPSPRKAVAEQPLLKPTGLVRTTSQKEGLSRSQPAAVLLDIQKPLPPVPQPSPRGQDGSGPGLGGSMRRQPSSGEGDVADALTRAEMILQRIITAASHAGSSSGISVTPPGSPRDKSLLQRSKDIETCAKQCEAIVLRLLQPTPSAPLTTSTSSSPRSSSNSSPATLQLLPTPQPPPSPRPAPDSANPTSLTPAETKASPEAKPAPPAEVAALKAELSAVKERSLKAIKQLMDENTHLKKKREELRTQAEGSKVTKEENAFLKSRMDMAVRKLGAKDEQIKKLRDKLEELQPGSSAPLLAAVREPSGAGAGGSNGGSQLSVGSPPSHGLLSTSASASGTSTPTSEVEKETAEWLGTVFKFLDDPKVSRYSTMVKDRSASFAQPASPREGEM